MTTVTTRPQPRFSWFVPIDGDGAHIGTLRAERTPTFGYLREVVQTAEEAGYYSVLIPTRFANGLFEESAPLAETWTMATALAAVTKRIRLLVAVRPGFINTGLFAQMAACLSQVSGGRIDINVVPGGIQGEFEKLGDAPDHDQRYERAEEFIAALRALWEKPVPVSFSGRTLHIEGHVVSPGPADPAPRFYVGGASPRALQFAAAQADAYLAWILPPEELAVLLDDTRTAYQQTGRTPHFGLRTHIVTRATEAAAWDACDDLLSQAAATVKQQRQGVFAGTAMTGQRAQLRTDVSARAPRLWNGISAVRVNCGTAIVGDPAQVAEELLAYWRLGIDEFILSGFPHVEECRRIAEEVLPLVRTLIERADA